MERWEEPAAVWCSIPSSPQLGSCSPGVLGLLSCGIVLRGHNWVILTPPTPTGARGRFRDSQTRLCPLALRSGCTERGLGSRGRRGPLQILIKYQHLLLPWLLLTEGICDSSCP